MGKKRTIYMSEPLIKLSESVQGGGFSRRLAEIVERYQMAIDLYTVPDFTTKESYILSEAVTGAVIDARKIRGLHLDILDCMGDDTVKIKLSKKIEAMSAPERIILIEKMGQ